MYKKLVLIFGLVSLFFSLFIFSLVVLIDPMQQYRKAEYYKPVYNNPNYTIPGIAKNYKYNSFILGSSMTENFNLSELADLEGFSSPIKLSLSGAKAKNLNILASVAFDKSIETVLLGLDIFSLTGKPTDTANGEGAIPYYLYDNNILNDYKYIFNIDTVFECIRPFIYRYLKGPNADVFNKSIMFSNNMSSDYYPNLIAINHYKSYLKKLHSLKNRSLFNYEFKQLKNNFDINILPMIQEHKDTKFIIFYPPYSILTYKFIDKKGWLDDFTRMKEYVFKSTASLKNVEIYDFQLENRITHNLHNYRDYSHYHYKINTWILKQIKNKKYLVSENNFKQNTKNLHKQVEVYSLPKL